MSDMRTFSRRISVRARRVEEGADRVVRSVILAVDQAVVLATPVDTGRARANWLPQIGSPANRVVDEPGSPSAGTQSALAAGEEVARSYRGGSRYQVVHITNSLPYIGRLNEGWSKQAPADFVGAAIISAVNAVKRARITR